MELNEIKATVTEIGKAFEEFKHTHEKSAKDRDVLLQEKMEKLSQIVATNYEAAQKAMDAMSAKFARPDTGNAYKDAAAEQKDAHGFFETKLWREKKLTAGDDVPVDMEGYRSYCKSFKRFLRKGDQHIVELEQKSMSVGSDIDGGYFVTPAVSSRIITKIFEGTPIMQIASVEQISTDSLEFVVDNDEASCGWVGEIGTRSETNTPTIGKKSIEAFELYAKPKVTLKLLEDGRVDVERWLGRKVGERFARKIGDGAINGTGVNQMRGMLTYAAGTSWGQIEQVVSGSAATVTADGLINLVTSLKDPYQPNASFLFRRATIAAIMQLKHNSQYIFLPIFREGINASPLLGQPVRFAADVPALGANALSVIYGDFAEAYTIVERVGISVLRDPYTTKGFVEFYTRMRLGGDVTNFDAIKIQKCST